MTSNLILASNSVARRRLLENAGLLFQCQGANINEREVEAPLLNADFSPADIAEFLGEAKAVEVSSRFSSAMVIGADQTMSFMENDEPRRFDKPETIDEARAQLLTLRGKTHFLHTAVCCVKDGETLWRHTSNAELKMRDFSPKFVGQYLADIGDDALTSVGAYQLEGRGAQLFDTIEGDYFTILGLPLLPLLEFLRSQGICDE